MKIVSENKFVEEVKEGLVIAHFFTKWCEPCERFSKILSELEEEDITVIEVDIDSCNPLALKYEIQSLPKIIIFKNGKKLRELEGIHTIPELKKHIQFARRKK